MPVTFTPVQHTVDYSSYDKAAARLFNVCTLLDNTGVPIAKRIPLVFASPERAFAQARKKFNLADNVPIPLPIISLQQIGDTQFDSRRYLSRFIKYRRVAANETSEKYYAHSHPQPYNFQYSAEIWCKDRYEGRAFAHQFLPQFKEGGFLYTSVDHGEPFGIKTVPVFLEGFSDTTSVDNGDQERSLRWTATFRFEGWLVPVVEEVFAVHRINVDVETPESFSEENPYVDSLTESWEPVVRGNPETGQIVEDSVAFDPDYAGTDWRQWRLNNSLVTGG